MSPLPLKLELLTGLIAFLSFGCSSSTTSDGKSGSCTNNGAVIADAAPNSGILKPFLSPKDPGARGIWFTASGEILALGGYPFPPVTDIGFVDGWDVQFSELLVTVDNIKLSQNPDLNPGDQSKTGREVARVSGPWAIDLHQGGPLLGKAGSGEQAVAIAGLTGENANDCAPFDLTLRYAFGFDVVTATESALNVNLDAQGLTDYAEMISKGYTVLYVGTATFNGSSCVPDDPEFLKPPLTVGSVVNFRLGFKSPTSYINCQNPDYQSAAHFTGEEFQRGIYAYSNKTSIAQVTIHTDHPFWDNTVHDAPMHFDQIAARYVGTTGVPTAVVEDFVTVDWTHFTDAQGSVVPWRNCVESQCGKGAAKNWCPPDNGTMHFANVDGAPLANYADFMTYNQRTQGHLNSDGLCYVKPR